MTCPTVAGLHNLVNTCMQVVEGDRVLVLLEPEGCEFYDTEVALEIEKYLEKMGVTVSILRPEIKSDPADFPEHVSSAMRISTHTLFLTRLGDYARFTPMMGNGAVTLCYARSLEALNSAFSSTCFNLMSVLLAKLEATLMRARKWRITCPLGTDLQGTFCWSSLEGGSDDEFSLTLFPVMTFKPVPCDSATGTVALSRWLMPGAAVKTDPAMVSFNDVVCAQVKNGQLVDLTGKAAAVEKVSDFLDHVSSSLGTSRNRIHSWHAGINPHTFFYQDVDSNLEAWGAVTFGSPRYLHFHTCGDVPPGEIAWSIFNPTVWIDDQRFWDNGEFIWMQDADHKTLLDQNSTGKTLLRESASIGV